MSFPWNKPESPKRRPRSDLNRHQPLPPITSDASTRSKSKSATPAPTVTFAVDPSPNPSKLTELERHVQLTEHSTKTLLHEALRIQQDIDQAFQMNQEIWRDEQQRRTMLANHVSSITNVVKSMSRELDGLETRINEQLLALRHQFQAFQAKLDASFSQLGFTHVQQEHVNGRVREAFQAVTASQQSFQALIQDQLRRFGERLDTLSIQINHNLAAKASTDSLGHIQATGLTEAQAALNVRIENLDGKVSQLVREVKTSTEMVNDLRLQYQEKHLSLQATLEDLRRDISQERLDRERNQTELQQQLLRFVESSCDQVGQTSSSNIKTLQTQMDAKIEAIQLELQRLSQTTSAKLEQQQTELHFKLNSDVSAAHTKVDACIALLEEKIQKIKSQQKEQVQTLDLLADALEEKTSHLTTKLDAVIKSVVIV
eukprot:m.102221 g.102221  ORF g.102221 m.102221 type:complete len:429 (-) comp15004_c0_seq5:141-1427(-)